MSAQGNENGERMLETLNLREVAFIAECTAEGINPAIKILLLAGGNGGSSAELNESEVVSK